MTFKITKTKEPDETLCMCLQPEQISKWSNQMMYIGIPKSLHPHCIWGRNEAYCPIILL